MNENDLEDACFTWLSELGYEVLTGDDVSPGGGDQDREHYSDVVLSSRLRAALEKFNPTAPLLKWMKLSIRLPDSLLNHWLMAIKPFTIGCEMALKWTAWGLMAYLRLFV